MRALAESLVDHREPLVAVLSVLDDKERHRDAAGVAAHCDEVVVHVQRQPAALSPPRWRR
jgi:hypothetical protein